MTLPDDTAARRVTALLGDRGRAWLEALPERVARLAEDWALGPFGEPFAGEGASFVAPVTDREGRALVLKLSPFVEGLPHEHAALDHWSGRGAVRVAAVDLDLGAMLLERAEPGTPLVESPGDAAAAAAAFAGVAAALRSADATPPAGLPDLTSWLARLDEPPPGSPPSFAPEQEHARALAHDLLVAAGDPIVLHGDLHHANLLEHRGAWVAVDPKGIVGPAEAEPAAFLRNPRRRIRAHADPVGFSLERASTISERLGYDPERMLGWGYVLAVVAAAWAIEDREGRAEAERWLRSASVLWEAHARAR